MIFKNKQGDGGLSSWILPLLIALLLLGAVLLAWGKAGNKNVKEVVNISENACTNGGWECEPVGLTEGCPNGRVAIPSSPSCPKLPDTNKKNICCEKETS